MRQLLVFLLAVVMSGCANGADSSAPTSTANTTTAAMTSSPTSTSGGGRTPQGYTAVLARTTDSDGTTREWCLLLADDDAERARGLMEVDSLGGYDGMLFHYDEPTRTSFYMFQTVLPLSIAFFGEDGRFVSAVDMPPCASPQAADCPLYPAADEFTDAIEVVQGELGALGIGEGSRLEVEETACARSG